MLFTEENVRDNVRNRDGKRVFFLGKTDQLTAAARDYLTRERIEICSGDRARVERYRLCNGGYLEEKPEHMTHLNGDVLVLKTHPRIAFRGAMDTLEAELMLCQLELDSELADRVGQVLELARNLIRWEVLEEPVPEAKLCGLTESEIRRRSHIPQEVYGQPHFMPSARDGREILQLNRARCAARAAELEAVRAFSDREGNPTRVDILRAMNRMSSMLYLFMIELKKKRSGHGGEAFSVRNKIN